MANTRVDRRERTEGRSRGFLGVWLLSLRDLQWRRRRFVIATVGVALVFAVTLVLSALAGTFRAEASRTLDALGADAWTVRAGITGPFTSFSTMPAEVWRVVLSSPSVQAADPVIVLHQTLRVPRLKSMNLFGYRLTGLGRPHIVGGRAPTRRGETVVDESLGLHLGQRFTLSGHTFQVVGLTQGMTFNAGTPNAYASIEDTQALAFQGRPLATAILSRGIPIDLPRGLQVMTKDQVRTDFLRPVGNAISGLNLMQVLLWIVAVCVVGSLVYLSALERTRDFAVLKATGYSSRSLLGGLALQSVMISVSAAIIATGLARALVPLFPIPLTIGAGPQVTLPIIGVVVGLIASLFGARRATAADPAVAFGSR